MRLELLVTRSRPPLIPSVPVDPTPTWYPPPHTMVPLFSDRLPPALICTASATVATTNNCWVALVKSTRSVGTPPPPSPWIVRSLIVSQPFDAPGFAVGLLKLRLYAPW